MLSKAVLIGLVVTFDLQLVLALSALNLFVLTSNEDYCVVLDIHTTALNCYKPVCQQYRSLETKWHSNALRYSRSHASAAPCL